MHSETIMPARGAQKREALIRAHTGLARSLALRLAGRVPASVDLDDLVGAGLLGLLDAVDRFDESRAIPFEAYARTRIQGAILDALRAEDHLSLTAGISRLQRKQLVEWNVTTVEALARMPLPLPLRPRHGNGRGMREIGRAHV